MLSRQRDLFAVVVACSLSGTVFAQTTVLPVQGGPGGGRFTSNCSGDFVAGIYMRAGAWLDSIGLKCAAFNSARGTFARPAWNKAFHGGSGGAEQERVCPPNSAVTAIRFGYTRDGSRPKYIDFVQITCRQVRPPRNTTSVDCMETGDGCWMFHPGQPNLRSFSQLCPDGQAAIGINGRAGAYVDAIGLICRPMPR